MIVRASLLVTLLLLSTACCRQIPDDIHSVSGLMDAWPTSITHDYSGLNLDPILARSKKTARGVPPGIAEESLTLHGRTNAGPATIAIVHEKFVRIDGHPVWGIYIMTDGNPAHCWSYEVANEDDRTLLAGLMRVAP